jgi:hypothetical protein
MSAVTVPERHDELSVAERPTMMVVHSPAPTDVATIADVRAAIAARDEQQIMAAAEGAMIAEWTYEFTVAGKTVMGLGVTGAMEIARIRAEQGYPVHFRDVFAEEITQNGVLGVRCIVKAREVRTGGEGVGMAFYPYYAERKDKPPEFDRYADRKALSVAKRNAILDLVPEIQVLQLLKHRKALIAQNEKRVTARATVEPPRRLAKAKPPVEPTDISLKREAAAVQRDAETVAGVDDSGLAHPVPGDTTPPTSQQLAKLLSFSDSPHLTADVRDRIALALDEGTLTAATATRWIERLTQLARAAK